MANIDFFDRLRSPIKPSFDIGSYTPSFYDIPRRRRRDDDEEEDRPRSAFRGGNARPVSRSPSPEPQEIIEEIADAIQGYEEKIKDENYHQVTMIETLIDAFGEEPKDPIRSDEIPSEVGKLVQIQKNNMIDNVTKQFAELSLLTIRHHTNKDILEKKEDKKVESTTYYGKNISEKIELSQNHFDPKELKIDKIGNFNTLLNLTITKLEDLLNDDDTFSKSKKLVFFDIIKEFVYHQDYQINKNYYNLRKHLVQQFSLLNNNYNILNFKEKHKLDFTKLHCYYKNDKYKILSDHINILYIDKENKNYQEKFFKLIRKWKIKHFTILEEMKINSFKIKHDTIYITKDDNHIKKIISKYKEKISITILNSINDEFHKFKDRFKLSFNVHLSRFKDFENYQKDIRLSLANKNSINYLDKNKFLFQILNEFNWISLIIDKRNDNHSNNEDENSFELV